MKEMELKERSRTVEQASAWVWKATLLLETITIDKPPEEENFALNHPYSTLQDARQAAKTLRMILRTLI
jgi:hypothetical protein